MSNLTFGLELEWADVDRRIELPRSLGSWDFEDYTIVNSDGRANDPTGAWPFGGEINTAPTTSAEECAEQVRLLAGLLNPTINYRCNLHVHVGVPELLHDIDLLKRVAAYARRNEDFVYSRVEPIPQPTREEYADPEAYRGAVKRYRRRLVSHHYSLPEARFAELMTATTLEEVYNSHAPFSSGRRHFQIAPRPGMNLRSIKKNGTIEFRHFPGSADPIEIESAVSWCRLFVEAALAGSPDASTIYESRGWTFPQFRPYIHELELGYQETKYQK